MNQSKTSVLSNGLIWFGAAVSIAEILTGTLIAPLGLLRGAAAILIGHVIGCILLFLAGLIGARTGKSGMETVKRSFGEKGSRLFSVLNILQLIGWTAVMIASGAAAANGIVKTSYPWIWSVLIGAFILLWILVGIKNLGKLNIIAMGLLFVLTMLLSVTIFDHTNITSMEGYLSFGAAVELSIAMPLSWLPLISDYTRLAAKPLKAASVSVIIYFAASTWMYMIGLGAALFTDETDIGRILVKAGLGIAALLIIIFSTVTTTFLDVYSAGVSSESIAKQFKTKPVAVSVCTLGTLLAIFASVSKFEDFLYIISSVFAPMIAIQISDYFILKRDYSNQDNHWPNLILWLVGFAVYRLFLRIETPLGSTLPVMLIVIVLCVATSYITGGQKIAKKNT